ncbi:dehydratase [Nocardia sp. FDAARGOS_372]|nr:dehydratase [Nocardia sp. FDAARGOS_372]
MYGEDIEVGRQYRLGTYTISERALVDFAALWDPQGFHVDKDVAEAGAYEGLIASGLHTLAVYQRLAVLDVFSGWSVIAGRRLREVRFLRPVRPGDTLTGTVVVQDVTFDDRDRALVTTAAELTDGQARPVLSVDVEAYVRARPPHIL